MNKEQLEQFDYSFTECRKHMKTMEGRDMLLKTRSMVLNLDTRLETLGYTVIEYMFSTMIPTMIQATLQLEDWKVMYLISPAKWLVKSDDEIRAYIAKALESMKEQ